MSCFSLPKTLLSSHITLGNEKCLKLLHVVCKTEERCDLSISLGPTRGLKQVMIAINAKKYVTRVCTVDNYGNLYRIK
jgi:hypothetical protein